MSVPRPSDAYLRDLWVAVREALLAEDRKYWAREPGYARKESAIPRGFIVDLCYFDGPTVVVHWSSEYGLGPNDYDSDAGHRFRALERMLTGTGRHCVQVSTGDRCGTIQLQFDPVPVADGEVAS